MMKHLRWLLYLVIVPIVFAQRTAAKSASPELQLKSAIVCGLIIGLYEAITLMKDVAVPQHKFGHAAHAFIYALVATFAVFNVEFVLGLIPALKTVPVISSVLGIRIIIGVITAIKVHAVSRATKAQANISGLSETWFHTFFVGGLVAASPYIWNLILPALPAFLR
ncbi:hypothetical protein GF342_02575 [Candidatus Woesearchaeota archaeon]|nr:hypothetical protein [Candidatus Woesearchaeota archaeon]